jgi:MFS transporter, ACS family, hexuronate transporter
MGNASTFHNPLVRNAAWKWWVCGLLFLATVINYMDRQALSQTSASIKAELKLSNEEYGQIETAFGISFAFGAVLVGWLADVRNVRWVYALSLLGWSAAGFATGFGQTFVALVACRSVLGLFEAGNWPCALRTTQKILTQAERTLGNSILQSGAAIGAILTPLVVEVLVVNETTWRRPFIVIGAAGGLWVLLWLVVIRNADLALPTPLDVESIGPRSLSVGDTVWRAYSDRRFLLCILLAIMINLTWHFFRVWLPLFLHESREYSQSFVNYFTAAYYAAAGCGSLAAGYATIYLVRRGMTVHGSRLIVFFVCAVLTLASLIVAILPSGPLFLTFLLLLAFGSLGLFPVYYSLSQQITLRHQGKVTGVLGCTTWLIVAVMHPLVGRWLDHTKNYSAVVATAGVLPFVALLGLVLFWRESAELRDGES